MMHKKSLNPQRSRDPLNSSHPEAINSSSRLSPMYERTESRPGSHIYTDINIFTDAWHGPQSSRAYNASFSSSNETPCTVIAQRSAVVPMKRGSRRARTRGRGVRVTAVQLILNWTSFLASTCRQL